MVLLKLLCARLSVFLVACVFQEDKHEDHVWVWVPFDNHDKKKVEEIAMTMHQDCGINVQEVVNMINELRG